MVSLGQIAASDGAHEALAAAGVSLTTLLARHQRGDRGEVHPYEMGLTDEDLGDLPTSIYLLPTQNAIWVMTEADESITTVLVVPRSILQQYGFRF